jgi:hypothetical protein
MEVIGELHAQVALPQGKSPWYPLDRRLGGPQSRFGRGDEEKNCQASPGIETYNSNRPARRPALYRLSCHGSIENRVLMGIFGPKRVEVTGSCRKMHNVELHTLHCSPNIAGLFKSMTMKWDM